MKVFFNEESSCQYCGNSYEDTEHFILSCPKYAIEWEVILHTIYNFITISVEILLHDTKKCNLTVNKQIVDAVHIGIKIPKDNKNILILICNCI